jgi:CDP-6-deoxy-D-xylo-4-hexulose-3-dehydrase
VPGESPVPVSGKVLDADEMMKLPDFVEARQRNFRILFEGLKNLEELFLLPRALPESEPSWFGFLLGVRPDAPFSRNDVVVFLESHKIATRLLFAGNLVRQPAYRDAPHRIVGSLANSDFVMNHVFWISLYPGLSADMLGYIVEVFHEIPKRLKPAA